ncbi:MAG TPA: CARDB domain-containing protein, partial [Kofleriaceae bacterium]
FAARWEGEIEPRYSETYTFYTYCDNGVRLWINGVLVIDRWPAHVGETAGTIALQAGQRYSIRVDFYEDSGGAQMKLSWSSPSQVKEIVPTSQLYAATPPAPTPVGTGTGLFARHFDNSDLTALVVTRVDPGIDFAYGSGSPSPSIGGDDFSSRWEGEVEPRYTETYRFFTLGDDGVRLWVNGVLLVNDWTAHAPTERWGDITLTAGQRYSIRLEHFEGGSGATIKLSWSSPNQLKEVIPATQLYPATPVTPTPPGTGTGLFARHYDNSDFTALKVTRIDAQVNYDYGSGSPSPLIAGDNFSSRWEGEVEARYSETYRFYTLGDDGVRLWVNGVQLVNDWTGHAPTERWGDIALVAGQRYVIRLEHYEGGSGATIKLSWSSGTQTKELIPTSQLYPLAVNWPQLVASSLSAPATGAAGTAVSLTWTVTNEGGATEPAFNDEVYLSSDATLGAGDVLLAGSPTARITPVLGGTSYTVTKTATVPFALPGNYHLIVKTDSGNGILETIETDNTTAVPFEVLAPDLRPTSLVAPLTISNGNIIALSWTIDNAGNATAGGTWTDKIYLSNDPTWDLTDTFVGQATRTTLAAGASYTTNATFQFPKSYPEGPAYLLVAADNNGNVFEGSEANNVYALSITATRPDFVVDAFTPPPTAGAGELVSFSFTVRNAGTGTAHGQWNSAGTNTYRWYDRLYLSTDASWDFSDIYVGDVIRHNAPLAAGASYSTTATLQFPTTLPNGGFSLLLVADANLDVSEGNEANNVYARPITIGRSDLVVDALTSPPSPANGELVPLTFTVRNAGTNTAQGLWDSSGTNTYRWYDRAYLSTDATWDAADTYVGQVIRHNTPLAASASYQVAVTMQMPKTYPAGAAHLILYTDQTAYISEYSEANNTRAIPVTITKPDFVVDAATSPTNAAAGELVPLTWTVRNAGTGTANGQWYTNGTDSYRWYDKVYLSTDATWDAADVYVGEIGRINAPIAAGATYTVNATLKFPTGMTNGSYQLLFIPDGNNDVGEISDGNNVHVRPIDIGRSDLIVDAFNAPAQAASGEYVAFSWTAKNTGTNTANGAWYTNGTDSYRWYDKVFLSSDPVLDAADIYVGELARINAPLAANASYSVAPAFQVPTATAPGNYYFLVALDQNANVSEISETNNVGARAVTIVRSDLVAESVSAPAAAPTGAPIAISWTVRNAGAGTANGRWYTNGTDSFRWYDKVYLSTDRTYDAADLYMGELSRTSAPLAPSATYTLSATLTLPATPGGAYYVLVRADANADVNEDDETNNVGAQATPIQLSAPDLTAVALNAPSAALTQVPIAVSWTVSNTGTGTAVPDWYDDIYVSTDGVCCGDANDVKAGSYLHTPDLAAGASYTASASVRLPKVGAGTYHLFVKTRAGTAMSDANPANDTLSRTIELRETVDAAIVSLTGTGGADLERPRFAPDSSRLVVADGNLARVFELATFTERGVFAAHTASLDSVGFSPTGDQILSGSRDGTARISDAITFAEQRSFSAATSRNPAAYSSDGARVLTGNGATPQLWDASAGTLLRTFLGHSNTVTWTALSPDGKAASASADKTARIWNAQTGALLFTLTGHTAQVNVVAFSPSGTEVVTGSDDGTLRFWNVATGQEIARITTGSKVGDAGYSADGLYVVSSDAASVLPGLGYLWERATLAGVRTFYHATENGTGTSPGTFTGIAISPDRTMVAATQPSGRIRIFGSGLTAIVPNIAVTLAAGTPAPVTLRANRTLYFRFAASAGAPLVFAFEGTASGDATYAPGAGSDPIAVQMQESFGAAPTPAAHDQSALGYASRLKTAIAVVDARDGSYYVSLAAPFLASG